MHCNISGVQPTECEGHSELWSPIHWKVSELMVEPIDPKKLFYQKINLTGYPGCGMDACNKYY